MINITMGVREWLKMKKYIGHVSVTYEYQEFDAEDGATIMTEEVECVLCYIKEQYCVVRLTDDMLEWYPTKEYKLGNTQVTISETFCDFIENIKTNYLFSGDDLSETKLIDLKYIIEKV